MHENYKFVNPVKRAASHKNITCACCTIYVSGLNNQTKELDEDYQRRFTEEKFSKDKVKLGIALLNKILGSQHRNWHDRNRNDRIH